MADEWYEIADETHFWLEWRLKAMLNQLEELNIPIDKALSVLEIGCGTGTLRTELESATKWTIDAADLNVNAISRAKYCRGRTMLYNIFDEHESMVESYDIVILYDVLEHIHHTGPFLASALRHLKPKGHLLVNVPALQKFYSDYDGFMGHYRRYEKTTLSREFDKLDIKIEDMRYWGFCMLPLLLARNFLMTLTKKSKSDTIKRGFTFPKGVSKLCDFGIRLFMRFEVSAFRNPPVGTSLLMAVRKN